MKQRKIKSHLKTKQKYFLTDSEVTGFFDTKVNINFGDYKMTNSKFLDNKGKVNNCSFWENAKSCKCARIRVVTKSVVIFRS